MNHQFYERYGRLKKNKRCIYSAPTSELQSVKPPQMMSSVCWYASEVRAGAVQADLQRASGCNTEINKTTGALSYSEEEMNRR